MSETSLIAAKTIFNKYPDEKAIKKDETYNSRITPPKMGRKSLVNNMRQLSIHSNRSNYNNKSNAQLHFHQSLRPQLMANSNNLIINNNNSNSATSIITKNANNILQKSLPNQIKNKFYMKKNTVQHTIPNQIKYNLHNQIKHNIPTQIKNTIPNQLKNNRQSPSPPLIFTNNNSTTSINNSLLDDDTNSDNNSMTSVSSSESIITFDIQKNSIHTHSKSLHTPPYNNRILRKLTKKRHKRRIQDPNTLNDTTVHLQKSMRNPDTQRKSSEKQRSRNTLNFLSENEKKRYEALYVTNRFTNLDLLDWWPDAIDSKSDQIFHIPDTGLILNLIVKSIWQRSNLSDTVLSKIFELVDMRKDGTLTRESFLIGMWLIDQSLLGKKIPLFIDDLVWNSVSMTKSKTDVLALNMKYKKDFRAEMSHIKRELKKEKEEKRQLQQQAAHTNYQHKKSQSNLI